MSIQVNLFVPVNLYVYPRKPAYPRNISSSRFICSSDVCQSRSNVSPSKPVRPSCAYPSKPGRLSNVNPIKPVLPSNTCLSKNVRPSKVYSSKSVCNSDICPNKSVCWTSFTCLRKRLFLFISLNGSFLGSLLDTVIILQSFRTILKINMPDVSFFTRFLSIFAIFNIIVLNFEKELLFLTSMQMFYL